MWSKKSIKIRRSLAGLERQYIAHLPTTMLCLQPVSVEYNGATLAIAISLDGSMVARGGECYVVLLKLSSRK